MIEIFKMNNEGIKKYGASENSILSISSNEKNVIIKYPKDVVSINGVMSNELYISMEEFKNIFDIQLVAYCSAANKIEDFDPDICEHGDCIYYLPCGWVVDKVNEDSKYSPYKKLDIRTVEDLLHWNDEYTHEEGYHLFIAAEEENLQFEYEVKDCDYCSNI